MNGISQLIAVTQLKAENANDEALQGESKQATQKQTAVAGFANQTAGLTKAFQQHPAFKLVEASTGEKGDALGIAGANPTQKSLGKYNRMFEMYSKIMANAHEMKKALIGNLPR